MANETTHQPIGNVAKNVLEMDSAYPSILHQLNDRQRSYLKKLGQSSMRDIVPIDLKLYRELMNLDLIVDKGRRVVLSKRGIEVFKSLESL